MFAIVRTGSKQYRVSEGSVLEIEKLDAEKGASVKLDEVLLVSNEGKTTVGQPLVAGASVECEVLEQKRGQKLTIFKKIRRHGKRLKKGHRQSLTRLQVKSIKA